MKINLTYYLKQKQLPVGYFQVMDNYGFATKNITYDFIYKQSKAVIRDLVEKDIKIIVVGKNLGWKQESNMGKVNNRKFYNFPHARLVEILKYKAMLKDILVIETEDSCTSKTRFIDNEEFKVFWGRVGDSNLNNMQNKSCIIKHALNTNAIINKIA